MKKHLLTYCFLLLLFSKSFAQYGSLLNRETIIKNDKGLAITLEQFDELMQTGKWLIQAVVSDRNELNYFQLLPKTAADISYQKEIKEEIKKRASQKKTLNKTPNFTIKDLDGTEYSNEKLKGKIVYLSFFWVTNQKILKEKIKDLNTLYAEYKNYKHIVFLGISYDSAENIKKIITEQKINFPIINNDLNLRRNFLISTYPTDIILDTKGNIFTYMQS